METLVSQPIEEVVNTVDGIDELRSVSGQGNSFVIATFNLNRDIDTAAQDVRDRVATSRARSAARRRPPVIAKFDNDSTRRADDRRFPADVRLRELTEFADKVVKVQLERAGGVGEVRRGRRSAIAPSMSGSMPTAGRLQDSHHRRARRSGAAERRCAGRQCRRPASANWSCAPWAASPIRAS